jgi:hypothetical protein
LQSSFRPVAAHAPSDIGRGRDTLPRDPATPKTRLDGRHFQEKKHFFMLKGSDVLTIPNPRGSKDIGVNLLKEILKEADVTREEWLKGR